MADELPKPSADDQSVMAEIEARIAQLDLVAEFEAAGSPYSELDENGRIVTHYPPRNPS